MIINWTNRAQHNSRSFVSVTYVSPAVGASSQELWNSIMVITAIHASMVYVVAKESLSLGSVAKASFALPVVPEKSIDG